MNPDTGATYVDLQSAREAGERLEDLVFVSGPPELVEVASRNMRLGAQEIERRARRRKQQKASRRRNR